MTHESASSSEKDEHGMCDYIDLSTGTNVV
jgi:hypothetical protein